MKNLSFLIIMALSLIFVGCGKKNDSGGEGTNIGFSANSYQVSTQEGKIHLQQAIAEVGGQTYQISTQSFQTISMAVSQGLNQQPPVQPIFEGGVQKYRATITGSLGNSGTIQNQQYPQQQQPGMQNILTITQIVIHN